jgi:paraquat-inducible protein B
MSMTAPLTQIDPDDVPEATVRKRRGFSFVWLVPLVAAAIAVWLGIVTLREQGPTITVSFDTADGLEAGKTKIKYKDVEIGVVDEVRLSEDFDGIIAIAKIAKPASRLMAEDTRFWVVRPRIGLSGVTGLGTLLSGAFIEIDPGTGSPATEFTGLKEPPPVTSNVPGRQFVLEADTLGSIERGAPIYYNGLRVGQVLSYSPIISTPVNGASPYRSSSRRLTTSWCAAAATFGTRAVSMYRSPARALTCRWNPCLRS